MATGCWLCYRNGDGEDHAEADHSLPVYLGFVMPRDWPGDWNNRRCCADCAALHRHLLRPMPVVRFWRTRQDHFVAS